MGKAGTAGSINTSGCAEQKGRGETEAHRGQQRKKAKRSECKDCRDEKRTGKYWNKSNARIE